MEYWIAGSVIVLNRLRRGKLLTANCLLLRKGLFSRGKKARSFSIQQLSNLSFPLCIKPLKIHHHKAMAFEGKGASCCGIHLISQQQQFFIKMIDGR